MFNHKSKAKGLLLLATVLFASCTKDFVDLQPPTQIPIDNYYKNESEIRQAVSGVYATLRGRYGRYWQFAEVPSDNTTYGGGSQAETLDFDWLTWTPANNFLSGEWNGHYQTIANCNIVLNRMTPVQMDAALKSRLRSEVLFIRGLMYFNLVKYFGGVQLITQELTNPAALNDIGRSSAGEVYAQIEKDLREAIGSLPVSYAAQADKGRVTIGAAKSLLAKVLMQQRKYADAVPLLNEVVASETAAGYGLPTNYASVFRTDLNPEIVFAVQYESDNQGSGSGFSHQFVPQSSGSTVYAPPVQTNDYNLGTRDLADAFETGDARKAVAIDSFGTANNKVYYARKWIVPLTVSFNGDIDWPVIRYADVLLLQAEALNETGATAQALIPLNRVRQRAGLVPLAALSQTSARDAIAKERRVELCFEGHRFHDLVRYGTFVSTMTAFKAKYNVTGMQVSENKQLFPIPLREILINSKLTQNPGY